MRNSQKTILFVEDNPFVLAIYQNWLEREGFQVESAEDGLIALEMLPQLKPALVILDLMLPKLDGLDVLKFIRKDASLKTMPILILSNVYMSERASNAMAAGANKRLLKTQCTPAKLIEAVHELLGTAPAAKSHLNDDDSKTDSDLAGAKDAARDEMRDSLLKDAPGEVSKIRDHCLAFVKTAGSLTDTEHLNELYQRVRLLCARAGLGDCSKIAHLSSALEAMLFEVIFKKASPPPSALQTIAQAVDCLGRLLESDDIYSIESMLKAKVLIVDDDSVCNFVTAAALKRARLEAVSAQDPVVALELAQAEHYDIVLLDINMPGLNGFEFCKKLRLLSGYQKTPVIFVTSNSEFQNRAKAVLSGGNDLIAKPILPLELALKTIMHLIDPREQPRAAKPKVEMKPPPPVASAVEKIESRASNISGAIDKSTGMKVGSPATAGSAPEKSKTGTSGNERIAPAVQHNSPPPLKTVMPDAKLSIPKLFTAEPPSLNPINTPFSGTNEKSSMKNPNENNQPFDKLIPEVARIIFGDAPASEMNTRLTRIALERYNVPEIINLAPETAARVNRSNPDGEPFTHIVHQVARIIFGDDGISEMQIRLTRIALEHYNVREIISAPAEASGRNGSQTSALSGIGIGA
ncbi:MAG: response regulator [Limisphaerales bacterium]